MISATRRSAVSTSAATRYCAANIAGSAHHVPRPRRRSTVLLELIVAAFIAAYVLLVAFGHVLVVIAIYRCLRERRRS
jgi:hypothetical protein